MFGKRIRRGAGAAFLTVGLVVAGTACSHTISNGNTAESAQQLQDSTNLENAQPLPIVFYSQERANMIDIELAEVNDVRTTTFVHAMGNIDPIFSCPSVGFGIPDSASLSNPSQIEQRYFNNTNSWDSGVVDQMDPNGIYAPQSSAGTWVICLDDHGQAYINRFESTTDTLGGPAEWNYTKHFAVMNGAPTALATVVDGKRKAVDKRPGAHSLPGATNTP